MIKQIKRIMSLILALILILSSSIFMVASASSPIQFKFKAKITGDICEVWGTNPRGIEGDWVTIIATTDEPPHNGLTGSDIVYIDQVRTGKNGSFLIKFRLMLDRVSSSEKIYIVMNSKDCSPSNYLEVDILPVIGTTSDISSNSIRVGMDVYEAYSPALTDDNMLESIKRGGHELYFKLGSEWYNLLDDKLVSNDRLVSDNALTDNEIESMSWARYYRNDSLEPVYFK